MERPLLRRSTGEVIHLSRTAVARTETDRRLTSLDALRFVAAASVVAFHYTARDSPAWSGPVPAELFGTSRWTQYGSMGVPLFFVISGFVILMSSWGRDVPSFVASRVGRLFPAYWVAVLVSLPLVLVFWPESPAFLGQQITTSGAFLNFTMAQAAFGAPDIDGVYWTLWYEARFYVLIALLMLVGLTRARVIALAVAWPVLGAVGMAAQSTLVNTVLMPDFSPFFAGGMLLYLLHRDGHDVGLWALVALQALFATNFTTGWYELVLSETTLWTPSKYVTAVVTVGCFGAVALVTLTPLARVGGRWCTVAGALTYPLYLLHENLGWAVIAKTRDLLGAWGAVAAASALALVVSALVWRLVEVPFGPRLRRATLRTIRGPRQDRPPTPVRTAGVRPTRHAHAAAPQLTTGSTDVTEELLLPGATHRRLPPPGQRPHPALPGVRPPQARPSVPHRRRAPVTGL